MGMLEQAAEWLEAEKRKSLAVPIRYVRKNGAELELKAVRGRTLFRAENEYGVTIRTETRDFLVAASDLPGDPERGDLILCDGFRYEALAPNGEPVWRWSGSCRLTRRIHTKETGEIE